MRRFTKYFFGVTIVNTMLSGRYTAYLKAGKNGSGLLLERALGYTDCLLVKYIDDLMMCK